MKHQRRELNVFSMSALDLLRQEWERLFCLQ